MYPWLSPLPSRYGRANTSEGNSHLRHCREEAGIMDGVGFDRLIAVRWGGVFFSLKNAAGATTSMHVFIPVSNRGCPGPCPLQSRRAQHPGTTNCEQIIKDYREPPEGSSLSPGMTTEASGKGAVVIYWLCHP